ncbi:type II secretion system F family protein [Rhizobium laguerreae]|uniref:type II secretion system F family protein n=1 Tax=Rhizobium laguerreae TaxID=1076926 RepID=UPI001C911C7F|nr:type II secretion system F family protein [Rhizobium laguerreae]MBY3328768.1 type II secretion system F family protein [Rhizobium laguerreae]
MAAWQRFRFKAFTGQGDIVEGELEAGSLDEALDSLWARGLTPLHTIPENVSTPWWQREIAWSDTPNVKAVAAYTREFAILSQAGLPIDSTLKILNEQSRSKSMRAIGQNVFAAVTAGASISDAWGRFPRTFGPDCVSLLRAGERRGNAAGALAEIADLLERRLAIRDKTRSALVYPCVLICMSILSVGVIMGALVPSIAPIFAQNEKDPPLIIALFLSLETHWKMVATSAIAVALFVASATIFALRTPSYRLIIDSALLRLPVVGLLILNHNTERFSRTLAALLSSGVPIHSAFTGAQEVCQNSFLRAELDEAYAALQDGSSLAKALEEHTHFPKIVAQMVAVGEASGKLSQMLHRAGVSAGSMVQQRVDRLMTLLTPALTIAVASLIGGLVFATMSAILSINDMALR